MRNERGMKRPLSDPPLTSQLLPVVSGDAIKEGCSRYGGLKGLYVLGANQGGHCRLVVHRHGLVKQAIHTDSTGEAV